MRGGSLRVIGAAAAMLGLMGGSHIGGAKVLRRVNPGPSLPGDMIGGAAPKKKSRQGHTRPLPTIDGLSFDALIYYGVMREPGDWMALAQQCGPHRTPRFVRFDSRDQGHRAFLKTHRRV